MAAILTAHTLVYKVACFCCSHQLLPNQCLYRYGTTAAVAVDNTFARPVLLFIPHLQLVRPSSNFASSLLTCVASHTQKHTRTLRNRAAQPCCHQHRSYYLSPYLHHVTHSGRSHITPRTITLSLYVSRAISLAPHSSTSTLHAYTRRRLSIHEWQIYYFYFLTLRVTPVTGSRVLFAAEPDAAKCWQWRWIGWFKSYVCVCASDSLLPRSCWKMYIFSYHLFSSSDVSIIWSRLWRRWC